MMRMIIWLVPLLLYCSGCSQRPPPQAAAAGFTRLSFSDEFNSTLDVGVTGHKWTYDAFYKTPNPANRTPFVVHDGYLTITAGPTVETGVDLTTQYRINDGSHTGGTSFLGGYFEARMRCTDWSAFWLYDFMRPVEVTPTGSEPLSWANEIDIVETGPDIPDGYFATLHRNTAASGGIQDAQQHIYHRVGSPVDDGTAWHIYGVLWTKHLITFYLDNVPIGSLVPFASTWKPVALFLTAQAGSVTGSGACNANPPVTDVDWVRVWQAP